ncbi:MAG TPA: glycosyltransferase family 9 protein [Rhodocyclaceae bacterium]|nr:glycosyltransferase family 9 protein [Rhodocyclaceae bacterium]
MTPHPSPKILLIRRDNIGDLVCTTPLIAALRARFPQAWLGALTNSYNAPVLQGNTDLDEVLAYTKAKHRHADESLAGILWRRFSMMRRLRQMRLDDIIVATPAAQPRSVRLARWLQPKRIIGFGAVPGLDVALEPGRADRHEVEEVFRVAALYGVEGAPPPCRVLAPSTAPPSVSPAPTFTLGVHISARKPSQRWPAERFAASIRQLAATDAQMRFKLLWSPGDATNPQHPGDDAKAQQVMAAAGDGVHLHACPTTQLAQLIAALAECDALICADGGAMHLAAGLGLPIVCLFGDSGAQHWRPWGVPYRLLQKPSRTVMDIEVAEVLTAFFELKKNSFVHEKHERREQKQ